MRRFPFYVYEFARTSGYAVPVSVIQALRETAPNLAGLEVSDTPWDNFSPYLIEGLDIFVGPEALIGQGISAGAAGAVSALATAFPELVAEAVREPGGEAARRVGALRSDVERFPRHAALKRVLVERGVQISEDVRRPLRPLTGEERPRSTLSCLPGSKPRQPSSRTRSSPSRLCFRPPLRPTGPIARRTVR